VFYLDSDILVVNHSQTIEAFLDEHLPLSGTQTVAFGENCMNKDFCWDGFPGPNGGMMLVRHAPSAFAFLQDWAAAGEDGRCEVYRTKHPLEQECVNLILYKKWFEAGVVKVPDTIQWKGADGTWLVHAFSSGGMAFPAEIISSLALRSFLYLLEREQPYLYWRAVSAQSPKSHRRSRPPRHQEGAAVDDQQPQRLRAAVEGQEEGGGAAAG
jgi:hypothetical protein